MHRATARFRALGFGGVAVGILAVFLASMVDLHEALVAFGVVGSIVAVGGWLTGGRRYERAARTASASDDSPERIVSARNEVAISLGADVVITAAAVALGDPGLTAACGGAFAGVGLAYLCIGHRLVALERASGNVLLTSPVPLFSRTSYFDSTALRWWSGPRADAELRRGQYERGV